MPHTPRNIQAPYTESDFWAKWGSVNPRMSLFVKIWPRAEFGGESAAIGVTSNTRDMVLPGHPGLTFRSAPGISPSDIESQLDEPINLEMTGIYTTGLIEHSDVWGGKWNHATVEVFSACWDNTDLGEFLHMRGKLGKFQDFQTHFKAEGRGHIAQLSNDVAQHTSRICRCPEFRGPECGHTAATVTIASVVYNVVETGIQVDGGYNAEDIFMTVIADDFAGNAPPENFYANGKMKVLSGGPNAGISREIAYNSASYGSSPAAMDIHLKRAFPFSFGGGELLELTAGCTHTIEDCIKFGNIVNRRAEDWIPGVEAANRVPPAR